jgi:hypothetical protein
MTKNDKRKYTKMFEIYIYVIGAVITGILVAGVYNMFNDFTNMNWFKFAIAVVVWPITIIVLIVMFIRGALKGY